jgi:prepilin-type N-terminal cleavage/methylation domain-containing protein
LLRRPTRFAQRGFTLIELMGVILILGLMISVTVMNWQKTLPRAQLNSAVRELSDILNSTRSEAIARGAEYRVLYDLDEQRYWVETPFKKGGGLALERIPGQEDPEEGKRLIVHATQLENGVRITRVALDGENYTDEQVFVRFSPLGASSAHSIELFHEFTGRTYTIEVLALTGLIRIHEGVFEREELSEEDFD